MLNLIKENEIASLLERLRQLQKAFEGDDVMIKIFLNKKGELGIVGVNNYTLTGVSVDGDGDDESALSLNQEGGLRIDEGKSFYFG